MPVNVFERELNDALYLKYNNGIYETGKKVVDRLIKYYKKEMVDGSSQTESLEIILNKYEDQITDFKKKIQIL